MTGETSGRIRSSAPTARGRRRGGAGDGRAGRAGGRRPRPDGRPRREDPDAPGAGPARGGSWRSRGSHRVEGRSAASNLAAAGRRRPGPPGRRRRRPPSARARGFDHRSSSTLPARGPGRSGRTRRSGHGSGPKTSSAFAALRRGLLRAALDLLAPGGSVTWITCSLEPEENEGVVDQVLGERPGLVKPVVPDRSRTCPNLFVGRAGRTECPDSAGTRERRLLRSHSPADPSIGRSTAGFPDFTIDKRERRAYISSGSRTATRRIKRHSKEREVWIHGW